MSRVCQEKYFRPQTCSIALITFFSLSCGLRSSQAGDIEQHVLTLTDRTINATIQKPGQTILLEIYAPWCGHCQKLAPEYGAAATTLSNDNVPVILAKVDATSNPKTADWLNVKGYPTLLWFASGQQQEVYSSARSRDAIVTWVKKRVLGLEAVDCLEALERVKRKSEIFLLGYLCSPRGKEFEDLRAVGRAVEEWPVYQTSSSEVAAALGLTSCPSFAVGTSFEYNNGSFQAVSSVGHGAFQRHEQLRDGLHSFLKTEQLPPYIPYSSATNQRVFAMDRQVFLIGPLLELQPDKAALQAVEVAHRRYKGEFAFATAALGTDPADMLLDFFGLKPGTGIQVVGFVPDSEKYKLLEPLSAKSLAHFCEGIVHGTYKRFYKSADVPARPKEGFVALVVGSTFEEIVLDPAKDVILMVYTIWSDKSKHLAVVWKKLAQHMRNVETFVAAKIEAESNEHPHLTGDAFPYVLFYAAGSTQPLKFSGEPSLKGLLKFVRQHAMNPIDFSGELPRIARTGNDEL